MAKCRECNGQGSDFDPSDFSNKRCQTCGGSGEVSDSPEHFATGALPPSDMEWMIGRTVEEIESINLFRRCKQHLLVAPGFTASSAKELVAAINEHLRSLGVQQ